MSPTIPSPGRWRAARAWLASAMLMSVSALVHAQAFIGITSASIFEGNSGARFLDFPITISGVTSGATTLTVTLLPGTGAAFTPATGGAACGPAGVDYEQFTPITTTLPSGSTGSGLFVRVRVCSDTALESDESVFVTLQVSGGGGSAQCLENCAAVGTIRNDDGSPGLRINNVTVSEPGLFATRTATFTVSSSFPVPAGTSVSFATRNGSATGGAAICLPGQPCSGDYASRSGTLTLPTDSLSATIGITVRGDTLNEGDETFFVDLSNPVGAVLSDATGRGTIVNAAFNTGSFSLAADDGPLRVNEQRVYELEWTVPDPLVWRQLRSIDLRIREGGGQALWLRWDEASNGFALCRHGRGPGSDDAPLRSGVTCRGDAQPGANEVLGDELAQLDLANAQVIGSGPTGTSVKLLLPLSFTARAGGRELRLEVAAADDFGNEDRFVGATTVRVQPRGDH